MKKSDCKYFWCTELDCKSYRTGIKCAECAIYQNCMHCILMNDSAVNSQETTTHNACYEMYDDIFSPIPREQQNDIF